MVSLVSFLPIISILKKNVNINVDGSCYELLGSAFAQYKNLEAQKSIIALQLQLDAIESPSATIPISFSGTKDGIIEFIGRLESYRFESFE